MPATKRVHRMDRICALIGGEHWALDESKLNAVISFLEGRAAGEELSEEEIAARTGTKTGDAEPAYQVLDGVAVIPLHGALAPRMDMMTRISGGTSMQTARAWLHQAISDDAVRAIVLDIDSPGGTVAGAAELADVVRSARGVKPIKAVASNVMASGAYWIGSAADEIIAGPSASLGSIGVYTIHWDESRANENAGLKATVVKAGANKGLGTGVEPLTSAGRQVVQEGVDDAYRMFVDAVATNRKVSAELVEERFGKGATMYGPRAVAVGMADRLGTLEQVLAEMRTENRPVRGGKRTNGPHAQAADGVTSSRSAPTTEDVMNKELMAALVEAGLVKAEASAEVAQAALGAFCLVRNVKLEDTSAILAALKKPAADEPPPKEATSTAPDSAVQARRDADQRSLERVRIQELNARAELLGIGKAQLDEAIENDWSVSRAADEWTRQLAKDRAPVSRREIQGGEASIDKFAKGALAVLCDRVGVESPDADAASFMPSLRHASVLDVARESLRVCGLRVEHMDREQVAIAAMRGVGPGADLTLMPKARRKGPKTEISYSTVETAPMADGGGAEGGGYNRPGDFPYLMSVLMGRMLLPALEDQEVTYADWTYRLASLPDFRPKTIIEVGGFGQFPLHIDGEDFEGSPSPPEEANFIQADSYGDEWTMTPKMILDDDLDGLGRVVSEKVRAHERTINQLCINILTGNPTMPDGIALFHASHTNLVDTGSGGVPSQAQLKLMRKNFRKQTAVNSNVKLNQKLVKILVPEDLETDAEVALAPLPIYPATTTNVETFRGKVQWIVDAMLGTASAAIWYGFANPQSAQSICFAHQSGYDSLRVRTYFNPKNNCRVNQFEGRFAAIARSWRGVQKNVGA